MKVRRIVWTAAVVVGLATWGVLAHSGPGTRESALAELQVGNLTCGSCIEKVRTAIGGMPGAGKVEVSLTTGRVKAQFDPDKTDPGALVRTLSEAGYPAAVKRVLSPEEYRILREDASRLASAYVGRIGGRLISREYFDRELTRLRGSSPTPPGASESALQREVWQSILQRETLMGEAERLRILVQDAEVEAEIGKMRQGMAGFEALVRDRFGGEEGFFRRLKEDLTIRRLVDGHVPGGESEGRLRQARLNEWYRDLVENTPVEVFDPALRSTLQSGSGCGGSCCG